MITVKDLRLLIENLPDEMPVLVDGWEAGYNYAEGATVKPVLLGTVAHYNGMHTPCEAHEKGSEFCLIIPSQ